MSWQRSMVRFHRCELSRVTAILMPNCVVTSSVNEIAQRLIFISMLYDTQQTNISEIFELANVVFDPGIRRPIDEFGTPEIRDKMRWAYLSRSPSRLIGHNFTKTKLMTRRLCCVFIPTRIVEAIYLDTFVFFA